MKKLITHNGSFHADDVFATATLSLLHDGKVEVIRTRDPEMIKTGDIVFDVGAAYDAEKNLFDHHQAGGAGKRENGIPYAAFGLVWKKFGAETCGSEEVANMIEERLVQSVDAYDNGFSLAKTVLPDVYPYMIDSVIFSFRPTWKEKGTDEDAQFSEAVNFAKQLLLREIHRATDRLEGMNKVKEIYGRSADKKIIILDDDYPWSEVLGEFPEPLFVVHPRNDGKWEAAAVRVNRFEFKNRKDFPNSWAGKRDQDLAEVSGVPDAIFCHNNVFTAVAGSKEGAIELAKRALAQSSKK